MAPSRRQRKQALPTARGPTVSSNATPHDHDHERLAVTPRCFGRASHSIGWWTHVVPLRTVCGTSTSVFGPACQMAGHAGPVYGGLSPVGPSRVDDKTVLSQRLFVFCYFLLHTAHVYFV
jgi:hypothetical protein